MSEARLFDAPVQTTWTRKPGGGRCGRDPAAGPGTCWYWWEGCPDAEKRNCFNAFARLHLGKQYEVDGETVRLAQSTTLGETA